LATALNREFGTDLTANALKKRYRRWRESRPSAKSLRDLIGTRYVSDFVDEETEPERPLISLEDGAPPPEAAPEEPPEIVEEPVIKLPSKASPLPPDHIIRVTPPTHGYVFVTSDHHYPIHDQRAEAAVIALAQHLRPVKWVVNGDAIDAWWISRHEKEAERIVDRDSGIRIVDEVESFRPFMNEVANIVDEMYIGMGNHENRLSALINQNPGLHGLPGLRWENIINGPPNVRVMGYGYRLQMGPISAIHGDRLGGKFGLKYPTSWVLENQGARSVVFGHNHRLGSTFKTTWEDTGPRQVVALNQGHLSDVAKQRYTAEPNWQTGLVVLEFWTDGGHPRYTPHLVPIINGALSFAGRIFRG
jgi:hypothetical protein